MEAPNGRHDDFVDPYFKGAGADAVVVHPQSAGTGAHHDCGRRQQNKPMAPSDREPVGGSVQLLYQ
jgi:hypothetical protein